MSITRAESAKAIFIEKRKGAEVKIILMCAAWLILFCAASAEAQEIRSQYTGVSEKKCRTLEEEPGMYILLECAGAGGYKLKLADVDLRQNLAVVTPAGKEYDLDFNTEYFSYVSGKAEWRVKKANGKTVPAALVIRFYTQENPRNDLDVTAYFLAVKITADEICGVDVIKASAARAHQKARQSADASSGKPCLKKREI